MVKLWINRKKDSDDTEEVLLEFELRDPYDFADIKRKLKDIKGISSITLAHKRRKGIPDAIGYAKWSKNEVNNRLQEIRGISAITNTKPRLLMKS